MEVVRIGRNDFQIVYKQVKGRRRQYMRCMYISQSGPNKGQRCNYERRSDSKSFKETGGVHQHAFDIQCYFQKAEHKTLAQIEIRNNFLIFLSKTNLSFRQAASKETSQLLNSFIRYGFSLGKSQINNLDEENLWTYNNRQQIRDDLIHYSDQYCSNKLREFSKGKVHLSIDSTTINHIQTVDIVLLCNKENYQVESLLYKELILKNSSYIEYKFSMIDVLEELKGSGIRVLSIVSDGFSSQVAAFDPEKPTSFQNNRDIHSNFKQIFFVNCRCHLFNLCLNDLLNHSKGIKQCQNLLINLSKELRKTNNRTLIGAICPEHIQTRFCYDFRIIKFIISHLQKIETIHIKINQEIFIYGVILEKMWEVIGTFEARSATLAETYDIFLSFLNDLKRVEEMSQDKNLFLSLNCKLLRNIVYYRFRKQNKLALFAYSLTPKGRSYFRRMSYLEEPNLEDQRNVPGIVENFFFYSVVPSNERESEEEEEEEDSLDDDDDILIIDEIDGISYNADELNQVIRMYEEKNEKIKNEIEQNGLIKIGESLIHDYCKRGGIDENKTNLIIHQYYQWMGLPDLNEFQNFFGAEEHFWKLMSFSSKWKELGEFALLITTIPASEVENERLFSIKRNIVGKSSTRISPKLLTARARLLSKQ